MPVEQLGAGAAGQVDEVIAGLKLQPGAVVADIGAGAGAFTLPLAQAVTAYQGSAVLGSTFRVIATARPGVNLETLESAVRQELRSIADRAEGYDPDGCDGYCGLIPSH